MRVPTLLPNHQTRRRRGSLFGGAWGFTLVEVAISIAVLAITSVGGVSAFMMLNKYAANLRNISMARALCQERIEQALTLTFRPTASPTPIVPLAPSADLSQSGLLPILGPASSYDSTGAYIGPTTSAVTTETIPVFTQTESILNNNGVGSAATNSAVVTFMRTTKVAPASLNSAVAGNSSSLNIVLFTVTVSFNFRGQAYTTSMNTLRSPD